MIVRNILTCIFTFGWLSLLGQQFPSQMWHEGWLVTSDQDTISGLIKYDMSSDIVQLKRDEVVKTCSSRKLLYFQLYDKTVEDYRHFYSLPFEVNFDYKVPIIFEVLYEGSLTLLVREQIVEETIPQSPYYTAGTYSSRRKLAFTYYFLSKEGSITQYNGKRNDLLAQMVKRSSDIKQYIKENRLKTDRMRDLVRITAYYNSLI